MVLRVQRTGTGPAETLVPRTRCLPHPVLPQLRPRVEDGGEDGVEDEGLQ